MVTQLSKYTLHNLAIPWENINNDTLNTSGSNATTVYRVLTDPSVIVKTYRTVPAFLGAVAGN